jgi:hypothetical protein
MSRSSRHKLRHAISYSKSPVAPVSIYSILPAVGLAGTVSDNIVCTVVVNPRLRQETLECEGFANLVVDTLSNLAVVASTKWPTYM